MARIKDRDKLHEASISTVKSISKQKEEKKEKFLLLYQMEHRLMIVHCQQIKMII